MSKKLTTRLEEICLKDKKSIISGPFGSNISSKYFVESGVPVIRGNNLSLSFDKFYDDGFVFVTKEKAEELKCYAYPNDIIFTAAGTIGQVGIIPENSKYNEYVISNKQIRARIDNDKVDLLYIYYWLTSPWIKEVLIRSNKGSTVPLLTLNEVKDLPVFYPLSIEEQFNIGNTLETISKKIELNTKINDNLFNQLSALYNYWFIQFEFPDNNLKPYKTNSGKFVYSEAQNKEIPENWTIETLANNSISSIIKPGIDKFDNKTYYATADINNKDISVGSKISYDNRESRANMQPIKNSVWFAKMKNSVKHLFITDNMNFMINDGILSTGFCGLDCDELAFEYISSFISSPYFEIRKDILSHGATQEAVNNDDLNSINILIPDKETLLKYHRIANPIYKQITENICSNRKLQEIRDFLLPLLMNGQATIE